MKRGESSTPPAGCTTKPSARPRLAVALDRLGFVYGLQGRTAHAIAEFERAREGDPALFDAFYHLGATLWWTGDAERALDSLRSPCACSRITRRRGTTSDSR